MIHRAFVRCIEGSGCPGHTETPCLLGCANQYPCAPSFSLKNQYEVLHIFKSQQHTFVWRLPDVASEFLILPKNNTHHLPSPTSPAGQLLGFISMPAQPLPPLPLQFNLSTWVGSLCFVYCSSFFFLFLINVSLILNFNSSPSFFSISTLIIRPSSTQFPR